MVRLRKSCKVGLHFTLHLLYTFVQKNKYFHIFVVCIKIINSFANASALAVKKLTLNPIG